MKLDNIKNFKGITKIVFKTVSTLSLALIMMMSVGCSNANSQSIPAKVQTQQKQELVSVDKSICGIKIDKTKYYIIKDNKLSEISFTDQTINFKNLKDLTKEQVKELEKFSAGKYVDHTKLVKGILLDNEFVYVNGDNMTILNSKKNKDAKKEKLEVKMTKKHKEVLNKSLNGFILDVNKIK